MTDTVAAVGGRASSGTAPAAPSLPDERAPRSWAWLGLVPFLLFLILFLIVPAISVFSSSFYDRNDNFGLGALKDAFSGQNLDAFKFSVRLSALSAFTGVVIGGLLAYAAAILRRPKWLRSIITSFSGVAANLGGIPLAFAFIALLGRQGLGTKIFSALGWDLYPGFELGDIWGLNWVYMYFQIPLMVLITLPAIDGLKVAWRESAANLGGTSFTYWRRVGLPVLMPSLLGGFLLLFANAFSAYATAQAISDTSLIVPVRIGFYLRGDVSGGEQQLGYSLAAWMIIVMAMCMGFYWFLRRKAERWRA